MYRIVLILFILLTTSAFADDPVMCAGIDSLEQPVLTHVSISDTIEGIAIFALFPEDTVTIGSDNLVTHSLGLVEKARDWKVAAIILQ